MEQSKKDIKNWDRITILILIAAGIILCFSFFAPIIFTSRSINEIFDFSETGQIGDTIGGIINPFIALVGILLTFLAFYMQIKTNEMQISQFQKGLTHNKNLKDYHTKKDYLNKLNLLKLDLKLIIGDIQSKAKNLKSYYEKEAENPFAGNILMRTASRPYNRILEFDRLSIYSGFTTFLKHRENWIKEFSNLYSILEFLPEFFADIYQKYEYHSKDQYAKKQEVRKSLIVLMDDLSSLIQDYQNKSPDNYLELPIPSLANETIGRYYDMIYEHVNEEGIPTQETDFEKLNTDVLEFYLTSAIELRRQNPIFGKELFYLNKQCSNLRKDMGEIKLRGIEFSKNVKILHDYLISEDNDKKVP
jgi:hypothetical protein